MTSGKVSMQSRYRVHLDYGRQCPTPQGSSRSLVRGNWRLSLETENRPVSQRGIFYGEGGKGTRSTLVPSLTVSTHLYHTPTGLLEFSLARVLGKG